MDEVLPSTSWRCREARHQGGHDIFISYRSDADDVFAEMLALALRPSYSVFLDRHCLNFGEDWEAGFLNGMRGVRLVILLVSEGAIEGIKMAHEGPDNVLLEFEMALALQRSGQAAVIPILLGKHVLDAHGVKMYAPFSNFDLSSFADAPPNHRRASARSVRATMGELYRLQGLKIDPRDTPAVFERIEAEVQRRKPLPLMVAVVGTRASTAFASSPFLGTLSGWRMMENSDQQLATVSGAYRDPHDNRGARHSKVSPGSAPYGVVDVKNLKEKKALVKKKINRGAISAPTNFQVLSQN
jgi:hypothetical protein